MQHVESLSGNLDHDHIEDQWQDETASLQGSVQNSSGPDEEVFDSSSHRSSPRTSHGSFEGSMDEDSWISQPPKSPVHTPIKMRSPFRNPSSVRAMQTDITPPERPSFSASRRKKISTPSRQGTPRSTHSLYSPMRSPDRKTKKEFPLVLLHVTLLAMPTQYSPELLESVLPPTIAINWRLLEEKIAQTVLERGILIPHPREDYDLLEERLLESLDLKLPRILKCGHFHLTPEEEADVIDRDSEEEEDDNDDGVDTCDDCGRKIRDGRFGDAGSGSKRWDIKVFAANGLMRAGAWGAAWKEMERVDVQILPWMEKGMSRELERRSQEDERIRIEHEQISRDHGVGSLDDERLREIYGQNPMDLEAESATKAKGQSQHTWMAGENEQLPLLELLKRVLVVSARDRKNIAIVLLSALVLLLALQMRAPDTISPGTERAATPPAMATLSDESIISAIPEIPEATSPFEDMTSPESASTFVMTSEQEKTESKGHPWEHTAEDPVEGEILE